ncbi:MAG: stage II sporulation protein D [Sarcina sp.]
MNKTEIKNIINHAIRLIKNIRLHKFRNVIIILIVIMIVFSIPVIFGVMSNDTYKKISIEEKVKANEKFSSIKGEELNIDTSIVKVVTKNGLKKIPLEEYIEGVVSTELPLSFEDEAMAAQAIAARTFVVSKMITPCSKVREEGGIICDTTHCQVYSPLDDRLNSLGSDGEKYRGKVLDAIEKTKGTVLTYEGLLVRYPQYFAISSGKTENGNDVFNTEAPYLKSVVSTGEEHLPKYKTEVKLSYDEFLGKANNNYKTGLSKKNIKNNVKVISRTEGGSVSEIKLGEVTIKGTEFRQLFGLYSANFNIEFNEEILITCKGYGHGVGMSQWGANAMAKDDKTFEEIIKHYYTGVEITNIDKIRIEK